MLYPLSYEGLRCILPGQSTTVARPALLSVPAVPIACHNAVARGADGRSIVA